jgi:hypothetical protein
VSHLQGITAGSAHDSTSVPSEGETRSRAASKAGSLVQVDVPPIYDGNTHDGGDTATEVREAWSREDSVIISDHDFTVDPRVHPLQYALHKIRQRFGGPQWFPWWFIFVIYFLCMAYVAIAIYLLIIYGIKFGSRANGWLQACALSVVQDIFINTPSGFFAKTVLLVLILEFLEAVFFRTSLDLLFKRLPTRQQETIRTPVIDIGNQNIEETMLQQRIAAQEEQLNDVQEEEEDQLQSIVEGHNEEVVALEHQHQQEL